MGVIAGMIGVDLVSLGTILGIIAAGSLAAIIKSYNNGMVGRALEKRRTATDAHRAIPELSEKIDDVGRDVKYTREKVDHVEEKTEDIDQRVDRVARTMVVVHATDDQPMRVDVDEMRERLDVDELDEDLIGSEKA